MLRKVDDKTLATKSFKNFFERGTFIYVVNALYLHTNIIINIH